MNKHQKYQFIQEVIVKCGTDHNLSREDIDLALRYFRELTTNNQYPGTKAKAMQDGATLTSALSNISKSPM